MKRKLAAAWIAVTLLHLSTVSTRAQEKIRVAISNFSASYIPMYLAQKHGYFAEEGMTSEVILMRGLTGTRALIGNSVSRRSWSSRGRKIAN